MKIKTSKTNRVNLAVRLMDGVLVKFDHNLEGELEDESKLEALLERDPSISLVGEEEATSETVVETEVKEPKVEEPVVEEKTAEKPSEVETINDGSGDVPPEGDPVKEETEATPDTAEAANEDVADEDKVIDADAAEDFLDLNDLKVDELRSLCEGAELPKEEWKDLKKADLIAYIEKHTKED